MLASRFAYKNTYIKSQKHEEKQEGINSSCFLLVQIRSRSIHTHVAGIQSLAIVQFSSQCVVLLLYSLKTFHMLRSDE